MGCGEGGGAAEEISLNSFHVDARPRRSCPSLHLRFTFSSNFSCAATKAARGPAHGRRHRIKFSAARQLMSSLRYQQTPRPPTASGPPAVAQVEGTGGTLVGIGSVAASPASRSGSSAALSRNDRLVPGAQRFLAAPSWRVAGVEGEAS